MSSPSGEIQQLVNPDFSVRELKRRKESDRPSCSLVVPAYNEEALLPRNLERICRYMESLEDRYEWELILINDGSTDATGGLAEAFAKRRSNVQVLHHVTNFGLGQAFKYAFSRSKGDYVVTLDLDLSYALEHIERLLAKAQESRAKMVLASPYMRGGKISNVPWMRRTLSILANRFLSLAAEGHLSTLTSMVRAYDGPFLRSLNLRSMGMDIMPEIVHKAMILGARIEEIPAHLDWSSWKAESQERRSSMRVMRHIASTLVSGFLFRPFMFFILPGLALLVFSLYVNGWVLSHFVEHFQALAQHPGIFERASAAVAGAYVQAPHTFVIGMLSLMLAIQLMSLGILALQSKKYFEEIFHLGTSVRRSVQEVSRSPDDA